jgi:uncharacterized protein (TIGR02246 family)
LAAFPACSTPSFRPEDEARIRAVLEAQRAAWNRGDLDAFMDGYHHDDAIVFTSGAKIRRGYDEALQSYRHRYASGDAKMGALAFEDVEITSLGPDAAVALGHFELTETPQAGRGVFSLVFTRRGNRWGIMHDHSSAAEPDH